MAKFSEIISNKLFFLALNAYNKRKYKVYKKVIN